MAISMAAAQFEKDSAEIRSSVQRLEDRFQEMQKRVGKSSDQVSKELNKLTDSAELLSAGIRKVRNIVEGMVWGTVIAGVTAYAIKMLDSARAAEELAKKTDGVISSLQGLSQQVNPSIKESEALTRANFELAKAKLVLAQKTAEATSEEIKSSIAHLESISILDKTKIFLKSFFTTWGTYKDAIAEVSKAEDENKLKIAELRAQLEVLDKSLKTQIPSWEAFKIMVQGVKEEIIRPIKQPLDVMLAELEDFQAQISQKTLTGPTFTTDPSALEKERQRIAAHNQELADIQADYDRRIAASRAATYQTLNNLADIFYSLSGQKSKRMFKMWQNFTAGMAVGDAIGASLKALNNPPGPPSTIPFAAAVLSKGLAQAVQIKSLSFSGGGGGGGGGGISAISAIPQSEIRGGNERQPPPPLEVNVTIQGNVIGEDAWVNERLIPRIEDAVRNERSNLSMKDD